MSTYRVRVLSRAVLGLLVIVPLGLAPAPVQATIGFDRVDQAGTYASLTHPDYDGVARLRDVIGSSPDSTLIGLGTFDQLDGELVIVGGRAYRVGTTGTPVAVSLNRRTPFVQAIGFRADASRRLPTGTSCSDLVAVIDELVGSTRGVVAVRMTGTFTDLVTASTRRQSRPYRPLAAVLARQVQFPLGAVTADLVGFRTGADFDGVAAPGLTLHGLTADRSAGGRVLRCATDRVRLAVDITDGVHLLDR